eukprot:12758068-Ditylum_brightwellii.AAC.1
MSTACSHLPRCNNTMHNGRDNDWPIGIIQSAMQQWLTYLQPNSNICACSHATKVAQSVSSCVFDD